ncbi:SOS response-associated peptidase [Candidimonas humi]|uniref:Abasic site processing protein n=1 Tax=Candidimonas humi TaxID=683355 RepID=A0ABV8NYN9_9BURK|nr:SOS response-associated peptidase [Candidimonas humi]MBV6304957.1 SOS response-associated peptidase [Candidimonas humi]
MLSHRELKAIQDGNRRHQDVMTLLREIRRFRDLLVPIRQYLGKLVTRDQSPEQQALFREIYDAIKLEPCVLEYERMLETRRRIEREQIVSGVYAQQERELEMCGRIKQEKSGREYMETWGTDDYTVLDVPSEHPRPRYNVAPGAMPWTIHWLDDGRLAIARLFWGYEPSWGKRGPAANARLDKLVDDSPFWRGTMSRRVIVPADGWYEWTGEKPDKQPWYIHPRDAQTIWLAAVCGWKPGAEHDGHHGFAIVTSDARDVLQQIHPRRPLTLTLELAQAWTDRGTTPKAALEILKEAQSEADFTWHQVTRAMGNSKYQGEDSSAPLPAAKMSDFKPLLGPGGIG